MQPLLRAVDERYQAAASVEVECHSLEWPTMRDALWVLRDLSRAADGGVSRLLEDLLAVAGRWSRLLSGTPLAPNTDNATVELAEAVRRHDDSGLDSRLHTHLGRLAGLLDALVAQTHPAGACLEEVISRYGRTDEHDPPDVYLAADADQVSLIRGWLADDELDAEVRTVTNLRDAPVREALVLLGPPARYLLSSWCGPTEAGRLAGWLLSAPPAAHVHVVTWPGHLRLDPGTINVFPTTPASAIRFSRADPGGVGDAASDDDPVWLPPAIVNTRVIPAPSWVSDRDPVAARAFRLAGDYIVFYQAEPDEDSDAGPSPEVVTWDAAAVYVTNAESSRLRVGTVLLLRPEHSATDAELHRRADVLLAAKCGPGAPAAARAAKAELKEALTATRDIDEVHAALSAALNNNHLYARYILMNLDRSGYIAPERPGAYAALRTALGLDPDPDGRADRLLRELRAACRRAGVDIAAALVGTLRATTSWQNDLEAYGHGTVSGGPLLGQLDVRIVVAVDPAIRHIGRSHLGHQTLAADAAHRSPDWQKEET